MYIGIGKIRTRNRAGHIKTTRCAVFARPVGGKARIGLRRERVFRLLRNDIHHAAGIENAVKRGGRQQKQLTGRSLLDVAYRLLRF